MMKYYFFSFTLLILLAALGCSQGLKTVYVGGIVTLDSEPVEGATVTFYPVSEDGGAELAVGTTDAKGFYTITAASGGKFGRGTTPGEYMVSVAKRAPDPNEKVVDVPTVSSTDSKGGPDPKALQAREEAARKAGLPPPYLYLTPKKYGNPNTSGFKATVKKGKNKFDFPMTND